MDPWILRIMYQNPYIRYAIAMISKTMLPQNPDAKEEESGIDICEYARYQATATSTGKQASKEMGNGTGLDMGM